MATVVNFVTLKSQKNNEKHTHRLSMEQIDTLT